MKESVCVERENASHGLACKAFPPFIAFLAKING